MKIEEWLFVMTKKEPITIWEYHEAPEELQISQSGGDEDWLAEIPPHLADQYISWLDSGSSFGCCEVDEYEHPFKQGWKIKIGCHA